MFRVFRTKWKRASRKPPEPSKDSKSPPDGSSHGSDIFSNFDFDVEFRVGGSHEDTNHDDDAIDISPFSKPAEEISMQESSFSDCLVESPKKSSSKSKKEVKIPVSDVNLFPIFEESEWLDAKRQLFRLQKHGTSDDIRNVFTKRNSSDESILHIAAWKAPPGLFSFMISMVHELDRVKCLSLKDKDGNTPFHLLCANLNVDCVDFSIVKDILMLETGVLDKPNSYGDTPLHLLVASDALSMTQTPAFNEEAAIEDIVSTVLTQVGTDRLSSCKNAKGLTILHVAVANQVRMGVLSQLLRLLPSCTKHADERGMLPLHYVAASPLLPASIVEQLINIYPESIRIQDNNGDTPLHLQIVNAGRQDAEVDYNVIRVTELLLGEKHGKLTRRKSSGSRDSAPSLMLIQNNEGLTPLHACAIFWTPAELTRMLVDSPFADESALLKTRMGATALHLACESEHVHEIVDNIRLLSSKKSACAATDSEGRSPLVVAAQNSNASAEVVKALYRAYPEALTSPDRSGRIVLHHALSLGPNAKAVVVKELLKAAPETLKITWKGNTLLSEACKCGVPASVTKVLLSKKSDTEVVRKSKCATPAVMTRPKKSI